MASRILPLAILVLPALLTAAQGSWTIALLEDLIRSPGRTPTQEESLRQIEDVRSTKDLSPVVSAAFAAIQSRSLMAQLFGTTTLFAASQRAEGLALLSREGPAILRMFENPEPRLKMASVILVQAAKLPTATYEPRFLAALGDEEIPGQVKPFLIGLLAQNNSLVSQKQTVIATFLRSNVTLQNLLQSYNALASHPMDQTWHADLVAIGMAHRDDRVREMCINLLIRLGPNAVLRHRASILRIADNPLEAAAVRRLAQRALEN